MNKILIIDDDKELCMLMKKCIEKEHFSAAVAYTGTDGLQLFRESNDIVLVILDVMMPEMNGFQVLRKLRQKSNVPVLMLTAKAGEEDKVSGLQSGADDYLTKPFSIKELIARIHSLIRRYTTLNPITEEMDNIILKNMVIDKRNRSVYINNVLIELTGKEFNLLTLLAGHKGRVYTKKQIYAQIWEEAYVFDDSNLMSFISKLRKKIEPDPEHPYYILTVRGVGYRFNKEA